VREWAVQLLFQTDMNPGDLAEQLADFWSEHNVPEKSRSLVEGLVRGVVEHRDEIDGMITKYAENWAIRRMASVDRNIIRLGVYEMLHRPDIPPVVSINEAVDLAKYFNSAESGRFVNGILDRIRKEIDRPARTAKRARGNPSPS
jgi:N utilization substance protein B